ncbi:hypothetical protein EVAR_37741_1 [Eumeta japonica]|uniref:Reverse transcriptase domain-containing protein n=1 Tax=Eumeta variegata TaxID=151549 RepID=A0A4C1WQG9_EUMVA|nr:hypothetical protein EVAR_37741_1 [Eumeta japonica]
MRMPSNVKTGVPQGSTLSPVLCFAYVNDITRQRAYNSRFSRMTLSCFLDPIASKTFIRGYRGPLMS